MLFTAHSEGSRRDRRCRKGAGLESEIQLDTPGMKERVSLFKT